VFKMTRSILAGVAALATAVVPLAPAAAQPGDIVVSVPAPRPADRQWNGVHPRMQLAASIRVQTSDLDLTTEYDRRLLDKRVKLAADVACDRLDQIEPPTGVGAAMNPDSGDCRHLAMKGAEPQVRTAIRLDYG
jgi:UrcA family protein